MNDTTWEQFGRETSKPPPVPQVPLTEEQRARLDLPATLRPVLGQGVAQASVFEPALNHHRRAYRAGDPQFEDERTGRRWYAARCAAIDAILAAIARSPYADSLVLRGSVLLRAWYGQAAREPGDLDFVVVPTTWEVDEPRTAEMFEALAAAAERVGGAGGVRIVAKDAISEAIWTYDRVPGRRLLLPWEAEGLPGGSVQLDFVFNEDLLIPPEPTPIPPADGIGTGGPHARGPVLLAVTPELSLAWKVMWLVTDVHPQGKDLYDAMLLAEHTTLRYEVLRDAFAHAEEYQTQRPVRRADILKLATEWEHFRAEYPEEPENDSWYLHRLAAALAPTFGTVGGRPAGEYEAYVAWLEPHIERYRAQVGADRSAVNAALFRQHTTPHLSAIVMIRELLGRESTSLDDARRVMFPDEEWAAEPAWEWQRVARRDLIADLEALRLDPVAGEVGQS
ncbi:nucleotidyl transferase AbiEii/AbiGii toxin family protein [Actinospica durhamensis]|uniref:Nucleotidyl transferase AbiEii/AbiGii toxin family protein n=1 Tax=Actinospica durhamensis TaxID=1508375 RepID=A0A941EQV2_9ACTN|nr:nucleotidyl transferase AbiEii/AbiGii toxin family protein [Actinospica durhamensis]MBR7836795.1 nucleotidyl transferase AbiEii/AbiGii toxin family protein [Actinospica durhamensis]